MTRSLALSLLLPSTAAAFEGYYQSPTVHGDQLVFESEGDLWLVGLDGGTAERLTSHIEYEADPVLSPDGTKVAFLAGYDGGWQVYVMPLAGGSPQRVTYEDGVASLEGWTPTGEVLFASTAVPGPSGRTVLRAVDPTSGAATDWPLMDAHQGAVGPAGQLVVTRFGADRKGDHTRHYRGGAMAELWTLSPGADEATQLLPDLDANVQAPLWVGDRLFYLSDDSGLWNLHSMAADGTQRKAHTAFTDFPVRKPATDGASIVFSQGADLFRFDPETETAARVAIELRSDLDDARERWIADPLRFGGAMTLAPSGQSVAVTARGRITVAGLPRTRRIDIAVPPRLRARGAALSSDGEWVYAITSEGGQDEVVRFRADGQDVRETVTFDGDCRRWRFELSPDGRYLAHSDAKGRLWLTDLKKGRTSQIAHTPVGDDSFPEVVFAPDSKRLAFTMTDKARARLFLHDIAQQRTEQVSSDRFAAYSPAFSPDGRWLWFLSDRTFKATPGAPWGDRVMGPQFNERAGVYGLALTDDARFPFLSDALGVPPPQDEGAKAKKGGKSDADDVPEPIQVAWEGLAGRLYAVPAPAANYTGLAATSERLYVSRRGDDKAALLSIAIGPDAQIETFHGALDSFELSAEGDTLLLRKDNTAWIVPTGAKAPGDLAEMRVDLGGWRLNITPAEEWRQMFDDAWRMHRDLSFDPNMRGLDWEAIQRKYAPLVDRISHRAELGDLLGEMASELDILHSQAGSGELPRDEESGRDATLAADFEPVEGGLRVRRIINGDPDLLDERSPLSRPEVDVKVGDVLVSVNRRPVRTRAELSRTLVDQAGHPVLLEVRDPAGNTREVGATPLPARSLSWLRYRHWEQAQRAHVDRQSDGHIGYLHLYAMGGRDVADFAREYFAVNERAGLIIDVRGNRGGNVDSWIIGELARTAWAFWQSPYAEESHGSHNMQRAFRGHIVVLIDHSTYSDGETFAAGIKSLDLAPLVGTTTAGAGIWLSDRNPLVDGRGVRIAEYAQFDIDGNWLIEGQGVAPDIEVQNLPRASFEGQDAQLDRAIELLKAKIAAEPVPVLRGKPIPPVGTPGSDVERGSGR